MSQGKRVINQSGFTTEMPTSGNLKSGDSLFFTLPPGILTVPPDKLTQPPMSMGMT